MLSPVLLSSTGVLHIRMTTETVGKMRIELQQPAQSKYLQLCVGIDQLRPHSVAGLQLEWGFKHRLRRAFSGPKERCISRIGYCSGGSCTFNCDMACSATSRPAGL